MFTVLPLVFIIAYFQCQKLFWGDTSKLHGTGLATRPGPTAARPLWSCTMVRVPRILEPSCIKYTPFELPALFYNEPILAQCLHVSTANIGAI